MFADWLITPAEFTLSWEVVPTVDKLKMLIPVDAVSTLTI